MKIIDIPMLLSALVDVYGPRAGHSVISPCEQLAAVVSGVIAVHHHDIYRWDAGTASAVQVQPDQLHLAEFAICASCGRIEREFFWCPTLRQAFADLCSLDDARPAQWPQWDDLAEALQRARHAYPPPVTTAVIRALTDPAFGVQFRSLLMDAVLASTASIPAQVISIDRAVRGKA